MHLPWQCGTEVEVTMKRWSFLRVTCAAVVLIAGCLLLQAATAQDAHESLGPMDNPANKAPSPISEMMVSLRSGLKPELVGVHPRVYFTDRELAALRVKAHGPDEPMWQGVLRNLHALQAPPPAAPAQKRRAQNDVGLAIAEAAFAYKIEGKPEYLRVAKEYMDAAVSYKVWGYSYSKPNVDLAAGHLLYGMGVGYDLLYHDLTPAEREKYRAAIAYHGHLLYEFFRPKPGRSYAYSQNHTFIPIAGLAVAAYAVYGEVPEAAQWAALSRAIYQRVLQTYSKDGYYYEGYEYWIFATSWIVHYLDALQHATGEDLFDRPGLRQMYLYAAHGLLPGGQSVFDFGDVYDGAITRKKLGQDYARTHPDGHFETNYNLLYDLAAHFHDSKIQGVADWMKSLGQVNAEQWWTLAWHDDQLASTPMSQLQPWHYFPDHDVVFWRSDWGADATAIAFKCGPPEGHSTEELRRQYADWHLEEGHVHPDVNSFILYAHGHYLTGDSGYSGVPRTRDHNTLVMDGEGQGHEGQGHDAWAGMPYERLNQARIVHVELSADGFDVTGEGAGAYDAKTGLRSYLRQIQLVSAGVIEVRDSIRSEVPHIFTEYLHADGGLEPLGEGRFLLHGDGGQLHVLVQKPADAVFRIEPNIVMGPGKPGSVDKGELEQRGQRLAVSTALRERNAEFRWKLQY